MPEMTQMPARKISTDEIRCYREDGAAVLRGVLPTPWIERMRGAIQNILDHPGDAAVEYTAKGQRGRYYGDFFLWRRHPDFHAFMRDSPLADIAAQVLGGETVRFFYDQLLVKEPGTREETPWHQDLPYWPLRGEQIVSIWVPFDPADQRSGVVHYLKGSHTWGKRYAPSSFSNDSGFADIYAKAGLEPLPEMAPLLEEHEVLSWSMAPGDVLLHHPLTLHYAPGNASKHGRRRGLALRYTGDDVVYDSRPGTFIDNPKIRAIIPEITLADGAALSGELFPQVWPRQHVAI